MITERKPGGLDILFLYDPDIDLNIEYITVKVTNRNNIYEAREAITQREIAQLNISPNRLRLHKLYLVIEKLLKSEMP